MIFLGFVAARCTWSHQRLLSVPQSFSRQQRGWRENEPHRGGAPPPPTTTPLIGAPRRRRCRADEGQRQRARSVRDGFSGGSRRAAP